MRHNSLITTSTALLMMDSGLAPGTYYYVLSALDAAGESANSTEANATVLCAVPSAPFSLAATAQPGQVIPAWSAVTGATGYNLLRGTNSGGSYFLIAPNIEATSFIDSSVCSGATYYYAVQALDS